MICIVFIYSVYTDAEMLFTVQKYAEAQPRREQSLWETVTEF